MTRQCRICDNEYESWHDDDDVCDDCRCDIEAGFIDEDGKLLK